MHDREVLPGLTLSEALRFSDDNRVTPGVTGRVAHALGRLAQNSEEATPDEPNVASSDSRNWPRFRLELSIVATEADRVRLGEHPMDFDKTVAAHCPCCGAIRMNCVCFGGMTVINRTGEVTSISCKPGDHGRSRHGFD